MNISEMKNYKIYISKSKQSDFNQLLKLKSDLSKFKNIEVLEFQGGTYNTDLLLSADLVIFIPPKNSILDQVIKGYQIEVGRGQYEEFVNLKNNKLIPCELYYNNQFYTIEDCDTYIEGDQTWQEWGVLFIELESNTTDLEKVLDGYFEIDNFYSNNIKSFNNLKSSNNLKKLLIKEYGRN